MKKTITVFVNDRPKQFYLGLHVKNAIGSRKAREARERRLLVRDQDGNIVDVDGALYDGERLYLTSNDTSSIPHAKSSSD